MKQLTRFDCSCITNVRPTLSSFSHVDERDRNPDAISPPRALSPAAARAHACCSPARPHSQLTRAEKSKHSNHPH
ncbi:hypothetical protein QQF64_017812 [Cirrhinus molitorella]|uniref:Uncharacterized protein n=1 Tax=Cirrhinus molitorella TaxID=172907 RepID=A0ABR3LMZ5_9TELE